MVNYRAEPASQVVRRDADVARRAALEGDRIRFPKGDARIRGTSPARRLHRHCVSALRSTRRPTTRSTISAASNVSVRDG